LDDAVQQLVAPDGFRVSSAEQIMTALAIEYGVATPTDITDIKSALHIPFVMGGTFSIG
jgi:hypothetical protein